MDKCMGKEPTRGRMDLNTREATWMEKNKVTESFIILLVNNTLEIGSMANRKDLEK